MMYDDPRVNATIREGYEATNVLRKPLSGIVSGYHELPYILIAPDTGDTSHSVQVNGRINVSPRFVISADHLKEAFGDVFDPSTFDRQLHARVFSFACNRNKNIKVESQHFEVRHLEDNAEDRVSRVEDDLAREENVRTALIFGPRFDYYPVSLDRFVNEIVEREFRV